MIVQEEGQTIILQSIKNTIFHGKIELIGVKTVELLSKNRAVLGIIA